MILMCAFSVKLIDCCMYKSFDQLIENYSRLITQMYVLFCCIEYKQLAIFCWCFWV